MKKSFYIIIIFLSIVVNDYAQNLVPNSSFESSTICPPNLTYLYYAPPWFQPSTYFGNTTVSCSSDLFSTCAALSAPSAGVPLNFYGIQTPRTGNNYSGIGVWFTTANSREYIEVQLITPLVAGKMYCLEYYVSLSDSSNYSISNIGAYFSQDSLLDTTYLAITYCAPQIENPTANVLSDKNSWMKIEGNYVAVGGEKFITIGNFKNNISSNYLFLGGSTYDRAYYYIDDISVVDCDSVAGFDDIEKNLIFSLSPNPNNGSMTLKYTLNQNDAGVFRIYDVTGKLIDEKVLDSRSTQLQINTNLRKGIYFYQITVNERIVKSDKMIIN